MPRAVAAAVCVACLGAGAQTASAGADDGPTLKRGGAVVSTWSHAQRPAPVWREPARSSGAIARLHPDTEDGRPEIYLVIGSRVDEFGRDWRRIRLPGRPNGRTGWVLRRHLGTAHTVRTYLLIEREQLRARLYRGRRLVWSARVGIGAPGTPTPTGRFWVRERLRSVGRGGLYGPYAFGTSAYSVLSDWPGGGVIGIHGTNQPRLVPGRPSHGCVRLRNADIRRLWRLLPLGTPVRIR